MSTELTEALNIARHHVFADITSRPEWHDEVCRGKMFGVLLVADTAHASASCTAMLHDVGCCKALYAYSGQILGRSDWEGYVPAIYDYLQEDGHFKRHEAQITALNRRVTMAEHAPELALARRSLAEAEAEATREVEAYRAFIKEQKATRTVAEAQYQNAELRRIKRQAAERVAVAQAAVEAMESEINRLKTERKQRSDILQRWLFTQHRLTLPSGETRSLLEVFTDYAQQTGSRQTMPPSGTGECCAPRLLNYANANALTPIALAEFWYGASPKGEIRHHGQYYEPCQAKCIPILGAMARDVTALLRHQTTPQAAGQGGSGGKAMAVLFEDDYLIAVAKPAGLLSVPGRNSQHNAQDILRAMRPDLPFIKMIHRLDMDTSGVLLAAKDPETYTRMQAQFAQHEAVKKEYVAIVAHRGQSITHSLQGKVSLPLAADFVNRPRQRVDYEHGKHAVTRYSFTGRDVMRNISHTVQDSNVTLHEVVLTPLTGRTHQLRVHCAHPAGLGMPILGDPLYGNVAAERMYLHARSLVFSHPVTQEEVRIDCPLALPENEDNDKTTNN